VRGVLLVLGAGGRCETGGFFPIETLLDESSAAVREYEED